MDSPSLIEKTVHAINSDGGYFLLVFVFTFGNMAICFVASLMCFITKPISKLLYDFFGLITGSSLIAIFANLLICMPIAMISRNTQITLITGCIVTALCVLFVLLKFTRLTNMGLALERLDKNNASDEEYLRVYDKHFTEFCDTFFDIHSDEFFKALIRKLPKNFKNGTEIEISERMLANLINDFADEFPVEYPVEYVERFLLEFLVDFHEEFAKRFPNEFEAL